MRPAARPCRSTRTGPLGSVVSKSRGSAGLSVPDTSLQLPASRSTLASLQYVSLSSVAAVTLILMLISIPSSTRRIQWMLMPRLQPSSIQPRQTSTCLFLRLPRSPARLSPLRRCVVVSNPLCCSVLTTRTTRLLVGLRCPPPLSSRLPRLPPHSSRLTWPQQLPSRLPV